MPRPKSLKPAYCKHPSDRAYVRIDGKFIYLGDHGTQASRDEYDRVVGEWIGRSRVSLSKLSTLENPTSITVSTVLAAFWRHAQTYYRGPDGKPTPELDNFKHALRPLRRLYGATPAAGFDSIALDAIRTAMIKPGIVRDEQGNEVHREGWSRKYANRQIARIKQVFKWAVSKKLVPPMTHYDLTTLAALKRGRSEARETDKVRPVPIQFVDSIRPFLSRQINAMIDIQILCGARGGELCAMKVCDIDRSKPVWEYKPTSHKTAHHEHERVIRFGRKAQAIIKQSLKPNLAAYVFSPAEAEAERREHQRAARKTPLTPSQLKRAERAQNRQRERAPGQRYNSRSYCRAIARACDLADEWQKGGRVIGNDQRVVESWHPHQLPHNPAMMQTTVQRGDGGCGCVVGFHMDKPNAGAVAGFEMGCDVCVEHRSVSREKPRECSRFNRFIEIADLNTHVRPPTGFTFDFGKRR